MAAVKLHKLNGDTSWLIQLPRSSTSGSGDELSYYNLVLDPWLHPTPQIDGSFLFSRQTRIEPAAFGSLAELDHWLRSGPEPGKIDAVLFSHPFSDHLHPQTLTDKESIAVLQRATIFTPRDSLAALRTLKLSLDSNKVIDLSSIATKQDAAQTAVLPRGIAIEHLPARDWAISPAWKHLHGGILISCSNSAKDTKILYSPHGITPKSLPPPLVAPKSEEEEVRVLIHSFDRQTLPMIGTVACGFPNVLDLIPAYQPDLVLATHDEHKKGEGIVGRLLSREPFLMKEAKQLVQERYPQAQCELKQLIPGESISIT